MLEDIAVLTAGRMISEDLGIKLENITIDILGRAKRVLIEKDSTTIIDGADPKATIQARIAQIKGQIEETPSDYDKEKLQERLAKPAGGATESEVKQKTNRIDDALNATRAAVEEGIVPGGGVALLRQVGAQGSDRRQCRCAGRHFDRAQGAEAIGVTSRNAGVTQDCPTITFPEQV